MSYRRRAIALCVVGLAFSSAGCGSQDEEAPIGASPASNGAGGEDQAITATTGEIGDATLDVAGELDVAPGGQMQPADSQPTPAEGVGAAAECADPEATQRSIGAERYREGIVCLINALRTDRGLRVLRDDPRLGLSGSRHAREMVDDEYFSHEGSDGSTLVTRAVDARYPLRSSASWSMGETLAWGTGDLETPRAVVNAWMRSSGHRRILLREGWRDLGIGTALGIPTDDTVGATVSAEFGSHSSK